MTDEEPNEGEDCQKKKIIVETPTEIRCECDEMVSIGATCSCGITHEREVEETDECEDPWTGYERGEKKISD